MSLTRRSLLGALAALVAAPAAAIAAKKAEPRLNLETIQSAKEACHSALRPAFEALRAHRLRPVTIDGRRYYLEIDRVGLAEIIRPSRGQPFALVFPPE